MNLSYPHISVIVPVYNAEKFLNRCIDSILAQTFTVWELLLIDDGSKDRSGDICDEYAANDSRIRVFHKENGGVSSARNLGLDHAQGEWITFVDADDYVEENFLKSFEGNLDADLVVGGMEWHEGNGMKNVVINSSIAYGYHQCIKIAVEGSLSNLILLAPWGKLYRKGTIESAKNLRFNERMQICEDTYFVYSFIACSKDIRILSLVENGKYVYMPPSSINAKYQLPVDSAVYHMLELEKSYQSLQIMDVQFEIGLPYLFNERCMNDMPNNGKKWYKNRKVKELCLCRSAHLGFFAWVKTWLVFHFFYRLKMYQANKHAYK